MKFNEYPEHRNSGIEWVGDVPAHWDILKGAWLGSLFGSETVPEEHVVDQGPLPFIKVSSLSVEGFNLMQKSYFVSESWYKSVKPRKNFVVFPKRGAAVFTNKVNIVRENAVIDPNLMGWEVNDRAIPEYIAHILKLRGLNDIADVSTVPQINNKHISPMMFPVPPLSEQYEIAKFLNYETAKIDALIAKQQQLIALLQEKRQAVISHAVTKGLNPAAPLRDSGVEWLGMVPAHWRSSKLRWYCISIRDGTHTPPPRAEGVHRLLSVRNIINGHFVLRDDDRTMTPNAFLDLQRSYTVEPGDVLLAIVGGTTGKSAVAPKLENVTVQRSLAIIRPQRTELNSYFLNYWIQSNLLQGKIQEIAIKYAAQPGIYLDDVAGLVVPIPPITEQHEIVEFLDKRTDKLEVLITKAERAIELLQERRTALIAAAVTGKIDVRVWQPPCANAEGATP